MMQPRPRITRDFITPDPWDENQKRPTVAVVREVDISTNGNRITLEFTRSSKLIDVSTEVERNDLFIQVGTGQYKFQNPGNPKPRPGEPPLAVNNQFLCYVIYMLTKKNWQFAYDGSPITIETEAKPAIFESHQIDSTGALKITPSPNRRAAYVIANADKATNPQDYEHRINLHIDLVFEDINNDPKVFLPIIIDPDIRHPGGAEA